MLEFERGELMKILVLGGTKFFGIPMIQSLLKYNHDITIATRGHQPIPFESKVKHIKIDRQNQEDLKRHRLIQKHFH